ncbi:MAG: transporter ATP-binding protein [Nocardioides sp.]|nr:transporter ATP-binding protein [Nocardioides sp.]
MPDTVVRLEAVHVTLGEHRALRGVDLEVDAGRLTVVTGPNGAGKSTLIEVLAAVRRPGAGRVLRPTGPGASVAFVPQRSAVPDRLPVTVHEVVTMGAWGEAGPWRRVGATGRRRAQAALAGLGLTPLADRPFATLSGGERQRALLAQGLTRGADLLLLDEPTTGLDALSATYIGDAVLREVDRGVAVVCVSHDPQVIDLAQHVVRLEEGRVVLSEVCASPSYAGQVP